MLQSLSHVLLFATPRTAACQASLSFTMSINIGMDKDTWYIYTREYYSVLTKNEIMPFAANVDAPRDCHTKPSKPETNTTCYCLNVASKTMMQMKLFVRQK